MAGTAKAMYCVLILVLVDDGLGDQNKLTLNKKNYVLILVLVDDGLGDSNDANEKKIIMCLNPCFSG